MKHVKPEETSPFYVSSGFGNGKWTYSKNVWVCKNCGKRFVLHEKKK